MKVKICGVTNQEDALRAADLGADAVGFIFVAGSARRIEPGRAAEIILMLPPFVTAVGIFANSEEREVRQIVRDCGLGLIQLQGAEAPDFCRRLGPRVIKAIHIQDAASLNKMIPYRSVRAFVLDSHQPGQLGGSGKTFNWEIAAQAKKFGRVILAGGLTPENVAEAVRQVGPIGVDVSSGVESQIGKKDRDKMRRFIEAARKAAE